MNPIIFYKPLNNKFKKLINFKLKQFVYVLKTKLKWLYVYKFLYFFILPPKKNM